MKLNKDELAKVIARAWDTTLNESIGNGGNSNGVTHRKRSANWVCCLGREFQHLYSKTSKYRVFWKGNDGNRKEFKMNEFLFDVMVGRIKQTKSQRHSPSSLDYIAKCEWAIESELNESDSREVIIDMSKLVVADARYKLFVTSQRSNSREERLLEQCRPIAEACRGTVYFCFIAHPKNWDKAPKPPRLHVLVRDLSGSRWK